jgi:transposase-like protein
MPELTVKQQYWAEQLRLADSFDGSVAEYARSQNIEAKKLYRWRNYFRNSSTTKAKTKTTFTQVIGAPTPDSCLKLKLGATQLEFARLPNPQWLAELIAQSNTP